MILRERAASSYIMACGSTKGRKIALDRTVAARKPARHHPGFPTANYKYL
jgi:hypothetical protein